MIDVLIHIGTLVSGVIIGIYYWENTVTKKLRTINALQRATVEACRESKKILMKSIKEPERRAFWKLQKALASIGIGDEE